MCIKLIVLTNCVFVNSRDYNTFISQLRTGWFGEVTIKTIVSQTKGNKSKHNVCVQHCHSVDSFDRYQCSVVNSCKSKTEFPKKGKKKKNPNKQAKMKKKLHLLWLKYRPVRVAVNVSWQINP